MVGKYRTVTVLILAGLKFIIKMPNKKPGAAPHLKLLPLIAK